MTGAEYGWRLQWWLPLPLSPGEWSGRWCRCADAEAARVAGLAAVATGAAEGMIILERVSGTGVRSERATLSARELRKWSAEESLMPVGVQDPPLLPPLGRKALAILTLSRCREALLVAHQAEMIEVGVVASIIAIIHDAFDGFGPAVDGAQAVRMRP